MHKKSSKLIILASLALVAVLAAAPASAAGNPYLERAPRASLPLASHDCTATAGNLVTNCSFENGFTGWTVKDMATPYAPAGVFPAGTPMNGGIPLGVDPVFCALIPFCPPPSAFAFLTAPTQGTYSAVNGFDGGGPDFITYSQPVALTGGDCVLEFDYHAAWLMRQFGAPNTLNREFTVQVGNFSKQIFSAPGGSDADMFPMSASVTIPGCGNPAGTANLVFRWDVPQNFTGPAGFELDNVQLVCDPTPSNCSNAVADIGTLISSLGLSSATQAGLQGNVTNAVNQLAKGNITATVSQLSILLDAIKKDLIAGTLTAAQASELSTAVINAIAGLT